MAKHLKELTYSLKNNERAIFLLVNKYRVTEIISFINDYEYNNIKKIIYDSINFGLKIWNLQLNFSPNEVSIHKLVEITIYMINN